MSIQRSGACSALWRVVPRPDWSLHKQHIHLSLPNSVIYEDDQHSIRNSSIPTPVWECLHQLRVAGHEVFLVGGAVRDLLLHKQQEPKDFDLLTSAQLQKVKALFQHHNPRIIGRNFPICQLEAKGHKVEVSSMHTRPVAKPWSAVAAAAGAPADVAEHLLGSCTAPGRGRRISVVPHTTQQHQPLSWASARRANAAARDFTANALLYDPFQRILYDYIGGVPDIRAKELRCVGDARVRFQADPACLLRAVRCAARAGLRLEGSTQAALQAQAHLITSLNSPRLTAELTAMLAHGAAAPSLLMLQQTQLMQHLLPLHHHYLQRGGVKHQLQAGADITGRVSSGLQGVSGGTASPKDNCHEEDASVANPSPTQQLADSALGQMLNSTTARQSEQQQGQHDMPAVVAGTDQRHNRQTHPLQCVVDHQQDLLLKVAAALDRQVSVKQPATAEVVLACLTAPLLVETLQVAVHQLQQHLYHQQQHNTQEDRQHQQHCMKPKSGGVIDNFVHPGALAADNATSSCAANNISGNSNGNDDMWQVQSVDRAVLPQQQMASATAAAARAYSTGSSRSPVSTSNQSACSNAAAGGLDRPAQQLNLGADFASVVHLQAVALASQVCAMSATGDGGQSHSGTQLFGLHTPQLAAALLAQHIAVCRQLRLLAEANSHGRREQLRARQQQLPTQAQRQKQVVGTRHHNSAVHHISGVKFVSSSTQALLQQECASSDYEHAYPRTNKQYRRLMEQQRQAAAQQHYEAGHLEPVPSPRAMLTAAAEAVFGDRDDAYAHARKRQASRPQHRQHAAVVSGLALNQQELLVHQVLATAAAGFDVLEAAVSQLGGCGRYA